MKRFIISDVHGNLEALQAVLDDIEDNSSSKDRIVSLGDMVGYGPDPNECIELTQKRAAVSILGNHDYGVLGLTDINLFNTAAREAIVWTKENLTRESEKALLALKDKVVVEEGVGTFTHASPYQPTEWHYLITYGIAKLAFAALRTPLCFVGHSHQPIFVLEAPDTSISVIHPEDQPEITYTLESKYIINVGSVGQPRDGVNKACYVVWDDETHTVSVRRVAYDFRETQKRIFAEQLPIANAMRLESGL
ncbi:MAG: metallophosphoesterase [Candidatus Coatesbacteria bacterium]|nr:metallophosphoesterase [Candidatus Coatesbacteria bacterium]